MATEHINPVYFIVGILENDILGKLLKEFSEKYPLYDGSYINHYNEAEKTISRTSISDPDGHKLERFQDHFLKLLDVKIHKSLETLAVLHLNEPTKYKKLVKEILDYKERLRGFESNGLQFVDYMYEAYHKVLLHFDGSIILEAKSIKKDSEKGEKDLTKKSEKSTREENTHKDYRRYVSILKENPNYNTFPSKAIEETAIKVYKSTKTIERAIAFVELDNLS